MAKRYAEGTFCPFVGGECRKHECAMYVHVMGENPQTGTPFDHYDCSLAILPMLLIDGKRAADHGAAATESLRNEIVNAARASQRARNEAPRLNELPNHEPRVQLEHYDGEINE